VDRGADTGAVREEAEVGGDGRNLYPLEAVGPRAISWTIADR